MRTLIKVPIYVLIETEKGDQKKIMASLYKVTEDLLKGNTFNSLLTSKIKIGHQVTLIRTFTESSLAEEVLKKA